MAICKVPRPEPGLLVKQLVPGIREMQTAGTQQSLHLLDRFSNHLARIVDLNHQLNESLISAVKTPCQDGCNIEEYGAGRPSQSASSPMQSPCRI